MGEECSIKIWTLGPHIELALYKPCIDPVLTTIIAILLPAQNVELSSTSLLKPSPPSTQHSNNPDSFSNKHIDKWSKVDTPFVLLYQNINKIFLTYHV